MSQVETTEQAAAGLGAILLAEAVAGGHPVNVYDDGEAEPTVAEHVAEQVRQRVAPSEPAPTAEAVPQEAPAAEPASEQDTPGLPDFTPVEDDELDALLAEPDFEQEIEDEIAVEYEQIGESYDPDEARRVKALEKRNQYLEQQLVQKSKQGWVAENLRKYPLLNTYFADEVKALDATSRRAFARDAAALNDRYSKVLAGPLADIEALRTGTKAEAKAEARQEAATQWGLPVGDPAGSQASEADRAVQAELAEARARGAGLAERIAILAKTQKVI